jgi:hypothetical protein
VLLQWIEHPTVEVRKEVVFLRHWWLNEWRATKRYVGYLPPQRTTLRHHLDLLCRIPARAMDLSPFVTVFRVASV